jgi:hypothetical protein
VTLILTAPQESNDNERIEIVTSNQGPVSSYIKQLTTDLVRNMAAVAGITATDALNSLAALIVALQVSTAPATGSSPGYVSQTIINPGTVVWNNAADVPPGNWFRVRLGGPGGPGAGGMRQPGGSAATGGAPGGGGCWREMIFSRADIIAMLPLTIIVAPSPAGGLGRAAGNNGPQLFGATPTFSQFGPFKAFNGGCQIQASGVNALVTGGGGGGALSAGDSPATAAIPAWGGLPAVRLSVVFITIDTWNAAGLAGATGGAADDGTTASARNSRAGRTSEDGGGGGGSTGSSAATSGSGRGGDAVRGGGGGGGAASISAAAVATISAKGGDSGGSPGGAFGLAAPGGDGVAGDGTHAGTGGGGGGIGFKGGDGGNPCGGGGGGGANGGAGGAGGRGCCDIEAF